MRPYGDLSKAQERLLPHQFCLDCIIAMPGYDFREGQVRANCTSSGQPPMAARPTPSWSTDALEQVSIKKNCGIQFRQG
jgi:hypothetical protein